MADVKLKGQKVVYSEDRFPYLQGIPAANIHQAMHFVLPRDYLNHKARTLEDYDKNDPLAFIHIMTLTMLAEAVTNTLTYRGAEHGKFYLNDNPRIAILLNYIPRELFENEEEHSGLFSQEDMLDDDNIVALMFSILVLDVDLDMSDAISDQFLISKFGAPCHRPAEPKPPPNAGQQEPNENEAAAAAAAAHPPPPADNTGRPDTPGESVEAKTYYFPRQRGGASMLPPEVHNDSSAENLFRGIRDFRAYINLVCQTVAGTDFRYHCDWSDTKRVYDLGTEHPMHPTNAFSLAKAMSKLAVLDAHPFFCSEEYWTVNFRGMDGFQDSFGAPTWQASLGHPEPGTALTCAFFEPQLFNAAALMNYSLPHCKLADANIMRPNMKINRVMIDAGDGTQFNVLDMLESFGLHTANMQQKRAKAAAMNLDIFNTYFEVYAELEAGLRSMAGDLDNPTEEYVQKLTQFRQQGFSSFFSAMDTANEELPRAYRDMIFSVWDREDWTPSYDRMWQSVKDKMSPFAQYRVHEHVLLEVLNEIADSTIFLFHRTERCVYSIYMPRVGTHLNKEHIQIVAGAGGSKSDTINKLIRLLLEGTYDIQGGASAMGLLGEGKSERLLEIFHEMTENLAPETDPAGENMKIHLMLLTKLAEGKIAYKTSNEVVDRQGNKERKLFKSEGDYTNVIVAARNMKLLKLTSGGTGEAMYDRFNIHQLRPIIDKKRVSLINKVLDTGPAVKSKTFIKYQNQHRLFHRTIMDYGALICYYAVPLPDLRLFSDLAPLAVAYLANMRPELFFMLRDIGRLKTRMMVETVHFAARLALASPLNPTAVLQEIDGKTTPMFAEYEAESMGIEISKYTYANMDVLVYVLTEAMYEFTSAENSIILREFAERFSNYIPMGHGAERDPAFVMRDWNPPAPANVPPPPPPEIDTSANPIDQMIASLEPNYMAEIGRHVPSQGPLKEFVDRFLREHHNHLGLPNREIVRPQPGVNPKDAVYHARELTPITVDAEYEELYMLNAPPENGKKLFRDAMPHYKQEYIDGNVFINPNYVRIQGDYAEFARRVPGQVGNFNMSDADIRNLLWSLTTKDLITPYFPVINKMHPDAHKLIDVQSLRYIREAWIRFPKFKVPIVILDKQANCFYMLVSYLETDLYKVAAGMIEHISYNNTYRRHSIMGLPSQQSAIHFQPVEIAPVEGKRLYVARRQNSTKNVRKLVESYSVADDVVLQETDVFFFQDDIEEQYALAYLKLNFPATDRAALEDYTPRGIDRRLYGHDGFYSKYPHGLIEGVYPQVLLDEEEQEQEQQQQPQVTIPVVASTGNLEKRKIDNLPKPAKRQKGPSNVANILSDSHFCSEI